VSGDEDWRIKPGFLERIGPEDYRMQQGVQAQGTAKA